jgi:hypothetical protein
MIYQLQLGAARDADKLREFPVPVTAEPFGDVSRGGPSGLPHLVVKFVVAGGSSAAAKW